MCYIGTTTGNLKKKYSMKDTDKLVIVSLVVPDFHHYWSSFQL